MVKKRINCNKTIKLFRSVKKTHACEIKLSISMYFYFFHKCTAGKVRSQNVPRLISFCETFRVNTDIMLNLLPMFTL